MMRQRTKAPSSIEFKSTIASAAAAGAGTDHWEVRPCGMLVQKRNSDVDSAAAASGAAPVIRVRIKHGSNTHEIYTSSEASFGELKKLVSGPTGVHHEDQKILFRDRERQSSAFLDTCGVKDRSKLVVVEDETARAKRCLEMRRNAQMEKAAKSIEQISHHVDKLASKVSALEAIVSKGSKVAESDVLNLVEMLMNELLNLDGVIADGDVKIQRRMQVRRVQKYVETLDMIKIKNESSPAKEKVNSSNNRQPPPPLPPQQQKQILQPAARTAKWETSDSLSLPTSSSSTVSANTKASTAKPAPRFDWELF